MHFFYSIFIRFYGILMHLASFFKEKAKKWILGRTDWQENLSQKIDKKEKYCWIHCASAGEFEQAIPLITRIKNQGPRTKTKIAVSFFSPSGFEMYKNSDLADVFFYFPLDTKENSKKLIEILQPDFVLFIRNEIWLNVLSILHKKQITTFLANANLEQKRSFFYKLYLNKTYPLYTKIFDTTTYGNTKLESVVANKNKIFEDEILNSFCKDSLVVILGSSWQTEEKFMATFYNKYKATYPTLKIIIAPHEFDETKVTSLENLFTEKISIYSKYELRNTNYAILHLDKKGILKYAYRYADVAIIGGGFGKGVHNTTEAAVYGIPTIFGKNFYKFEEVKTMIDLQVAFAVNDYAAFENKLLEIFKDEALRTAQKNTLAQYFNQQESATEMIMKEIIDVVINTKNRK